MTLDLAKVRADVKIRGMDIGLFRGVWPLEGWDYRRKVTITEQSGNDLTDYQVLVELDSSNFDFTHAQSNGEDIRFTDLVGNLLDYWIESWDAGAEEAKVWVKVPSIPSNGTTELYMYYGNPSASSESDGDAVFEFFDDFDGENLDLDKWEIIDSSGSYSVSESILTITAAEEQIETISQNVNNYSLFSGDFKVIMRVRGFVGQDVGSHSNFGLSYDSETGKPTSADVAYVDQKSDPTKDDATDAIVYSYIDDLNGESNGGHRGNGFAVEKDDTSWTVDKTVNFDNSQYYIYKFIREGSTARVYRDEDLQSEITSNVPDANLGIMFCAQVYPGFTTTVNHYIDYVFACQYVSPEPSVSVGGEETP